MLKKLAAAAMALVMAASSVRAASLSDFNPWLWPHTTPSFDLTVDAVLNGGADFDTWRAGFNPIFKAMVDNVPISASTTPVVGAPVQRTGYNLRQIIGKFPGGPDIPTLLAVPDVIDPTKPIIIAIHGHEIPERGTVPASMFNPGYWPEKWAQAGYVVWVPSHLWYTQLAPQIAAGHSHHIVWTKMLSRVLDASIPYFPGHNGMVATGLSSGGVGASFLMAYRSDIDKGVFAGSLISLDYMRENYRIQGHPNQYDVKQIFDYAPIYALIAPKPAQWQMGRQDTFFPKTTAVGPSGTAFPGLPRPVSAQDFMGEWLLMKRVWEIKGGTPDLYVHSGGHIFDFPAAKTFVEAN